MASEQVRGHLAIAAAYSIFGLNVVLCKDIANSAVVSPYVLFTLRAIGASALFWLVSIFQPEEKVEKGDLWQMALASFLGLFLTQMSFLVGITMATAIISSGHASSRLWASEQHRMIGLMSREDQEAMASRNGSGMQRSRRISVLSI